ncbi:CCA tRNA nucleotidyltransferase 1, mitochondrial isoform X1 [Frankliniella occidentalis]|uniref:CCA tRNA nucleotidyltransferase 1, mitochondrial isoform X1 n=2 Tax=Frankliniella occidentalis TaxID=133901 RepID=A0A6J1TCU2_FRAOC|nr:CCA tRNA nucleotidyltransferase 1, mitochondrial isoform X1 [Frankliniella occidentalis]XP_026291078.1 CCA tRNA nucleotidyltransferase 1, mitochondrial isoform X1 [Frankliniella occidentalis]XP_026291079.1 CCA tRNA nucleotidyltransferase 1, mitochondrial isoform X1 [Frankliniella occidentalis]XP_052123046.1 CCA tRNA nucleotidyltransferase 1, mitochondrial isoform X1 [Frankliniella occidentalis]
MYCLSRFFIACCVVGSSKSAINCLGLGGRLSSSLSKHIFKVRDNPIIMKLDSKEFKAVFTPELETLANIFRKNNYEIRIAGGAVRDLLMGKQPKDLDFATVATPDEMKEMLNNEGIRMINPKGEAHGTITARINDSQNFEITTLRIDIETDGRHAKVQFTKDWRLDANRRDLTINSMFLDLDGTVYDYFHGYDDLVKRRVVFVGHAEDRIREDYLRILRFFRFFGRISTDPNNYDSETINVIKANASGLDRIAGERIWSELRLILSGNHGPLIFDKMLSIGLGPHLGLPEEPNRKELLSLIERTRGTVLNPVTYLSACINDLKEALTLNARLKMSTFERELAYFIVEHRAENCDIKPLLRFQKLMLNTKFKVSDVRQWCVEVLLYDGRSELAEEIKQWEMPRLPVTGSDLKFHVPNARQMSVVVSELKNYWADNDYKPEAEELLALVPKILEENVQPVPKKKK